MLLIFKGEDLLIELGDLSAQHVSLDLTQELLLDRFNIELQPHLVYFSAKFIDSLIACFDECFKMLNLCFEVLTFFTRGVLELLVLLSKELTFYYR